MKTLNITFHSIANSSSELINDYAITHGNLSLIVDNLRKITNGNPDIEIVIFFDDAYKGIIKAATKIQSEANFRIVTGVIIEKIGHQEHLNSDEIMEAFQMGIEVASHSMSHPALCLPGQTSFLAAGIYQNAARGKEKHLTSNEALYQLFESKNYLTSLLGREIDTFIYPYGLCNQAVIALIKAKKLYRVAYAVEHRLEKQGDNQLALPRFIYTNNYSPAEFIMLLRAAISSSAD